METDNDPDDRETERLFRGLLDTRSSGSALSKREMNQLAQPVTKVTAANIFTWHLNKHTVFENETDPERIKQRLWQKRVGVTETGRLTEAQIATQEQRLGIRLPSPWRDVYRHFNGGWVGTLLWGDMDSPRLDDIEPVPQGNHEYLALEDVAPLREILPGEWEELGYGTVDGSRLDPKLVAIALSGTQAMLLDYRLGDEPRVCLAYFSKYDDDPLATWETDGSTVWWPDVRVFFRGLYLQDRAV